LPVTTESAPDALILAIYGAKSVIFSSGCSSSPTISMSGRFAFSMVLAAERTDSPNE
jgi:hypothetical protein